MKNRRFFGVVLALLISSFVCAQSSALNPGQTLAQTADPKGSIQGTVLRAGTGQALKRARVILRRVNLSPSASTDLPQSRAMNLPPAMVQQLPAQVQSALATAASTQAVTDDSGRFAFNGVDPGQYRISVDRDGYTHQEFGQRSFNGTGTVITLATGQRLANIDFQMTPAGSISGRVFDEDGEPLAGVQMQAQSFTYQQGKRVLTPSGQSSPTNDLGEYRIYWLTPGDYYVSAMARRGLLTAVSPTVTPSQQNTGQRGVRGAAGRVVVQQSNNEEAYAPTYFPGTVVPEAASAVSLGAAAEVRGIDFTLRPTPTTHVGGQILVPATAAQNATPPPQPPAGRGGPQAFGRGGRGAGTNVTLTRISAGRGSYGPGGVNRTNIRDDGTFEITNVIPGSYSLSAISRQNGQQYSAHLKLDIGDGGIDNLSIPLRAGISIPGKVFVEGTLPAGFKLSQLRVNLQAADSAGPAGGVASGQVADDASFTLQNVSPMEYRLRVSGLPSGGYVMAGRVGSDDAVNQQFAVTGDQDVSMQLQIGFSAGRVTGTVVDAKGNPYPGALATLIPDEPSRSRPELYFSSPTDQYGHFSFASVPPGGYKLFAWEDIPNGAYQDPEFIRTYENRGKIMKIDPGGSVDQQVGVTRQ